MLIQGCSYNDTPRPETNKFRLYEPRSEIACSAAGGYWRLVGGAGSFRQEPSRWYRAWYRDGTITSMAMNLRLSPEAEEAVRREAERTGRSQQEVIREAIGRHLGLVTGESARSELGVLVSMGNVRPPRAPSRKAVKRLRLPPGMTSADLLDRGD